MDTMNVLISLYKGYGLGDAVQMSAVLKHVVHERPHWKIDYQAEEGRYQVGNGIVANTFAYGRPYPSKHYDAEVQILLFDTWANWYDRPNTRVSSCLHERFGLGWKPEFGGYTVNVSDEAMDQAFVLIYGLENTTKLGTKIKESRHCKRPVAIHYQGDSSPEKKNLDHETVYKVCCALEHMDCTPIILDWRNRSPLQEHRRITTPSSWGANAEMVCAVISQCKAFVGIDSGPSKCASATNVPSMVVWTGHHPAPFHDPAPNTTHLVPHGYHNLTPVCNDPGVIKWFEANNNVIQYKFNMGDTIIDWLKEKLK